MRSGKPSGPTSLSSSNFGRTFRPFFSPSPGLPFPSSFPNGSLPAAPVFGPPAKVCEGAVGPARACLASASLASLSRSNAGASGLYIRSSSSPSSSRFSNKASTSGLAGGAGVARFLGPFVVAVAVGEEEGFAGDVFEGWDWRQLVGTRWARPRCHRET
jgi:hypothetical protein